MTEDMPFPVLFTFDLDGEAAFEELHPEQPYWVTQGAYGPKVGVKRILSLLNREKIKATFFVVGKTAERYPRVVEDIIKRGHEIACHGYNHKGYNELNIETERKEIEKSIETLTAISGQEPKGHRTPRWRPSNNTHKLLHERGFIYNSDYMGADFPFYNVIDGVKSKLVEIPVAFNLDDWPYYFDWGTPAEEVIDVWRHEFDSRYRERSVFCLTCHPQVTGRPSRLIVLEGLVDYIKKFPDLEFMTCTEYTNAEYL